MSTSKPLAGKIVGVFFGLFGLIACAIVAVEVAFKRLDLASASVAWLASLFPILIGVLAWMAQPLEAAGATRQSLYPKLIKAAGLAFIALGSIGLLWSGVAAIVDFQSGEGVGRNAFEFVSSPILILIGWLAHKRGAHMAQRFAQPDA